MLMNTFAALCAGFALNITVGSPPGILNPENSVPRLLMWIEKHLKRSYQNNSEAHRMAGLVLLLVSLMIFVGIPGVLIWLLYSASPVLALAIDYYLAWASFTMVGKKRELDRLARALETGRTEQARISMAKLTGFRCDDMTEDELIRRGVEYAADCTADNVAGVLFYTAIFGGLGGIFYRTVSILRRTYSVRSSASDDFGTAVHKLWTVLDFVPAHIAAFVSVLPANILGFPTEECLDMYKRDRKKLQAVVLAPCRCVFASALGISLTPKSVFQDGNILFLTIGDEEEPAAPEDVEAAGEIMYETAFFLFLLFGFIKLMLTLFVF